MVRRLSPVLKVTWLGPVFRGSTLTKQKVVFRLLCRRGEIDVEEADARCSQEICGGGGSPEAVSEERRGGWPGWRRRQVPKGRVEDVAVRPV